MCVQKEKFDLAQALQDSDINQEFLFEFDDDEEEEYESTDDESLPLNLTVSWHQHYFISPADEVLSHVDCLIS